MKNSIIKKSLISALGLITFTTTLMITSPNDTETNSVEKTDSEISEVIQGSPEPSTIPVNNTTVENVVEPKMKYIPKQEPVIEFKPAPEPVKKEVKKPVEQPIKSTVQKEKKAETVNESEIKEQPVEKKVEKKKPVHNPEKIDVNSNESSYTIATKITATECNPNMWKKNGSEAHNGITWFQYRGTDVEGTLLLSIEIKPSLQGRAEKIEHVAWHECGHAAQFTLSEKNWESVKKEANNLFNCKSNLECLADAMATVKTNTTVHNWYQKDFNNAQLELARKVWNINDMAQTEKSISNDYHDNMRNLF